MRRLKHRAKRNLKHYRRMTVGEITGIWPNRGDGIWHVRWGYRRRKVRT